MVGLDLNKIKPNEIKSAQLKGASGKSSMTINLSGCKSADEIKTKQA